MPLVPDPDDPRDTLLVDPAGRPLARTRLRSHECVAGRTRVLAGVAPDEIAAQARQDLAGLRVATVDQLLADALVDAGGTLHRVALDLRHDLADLPREPVVPAGWRLAPSGWDEDLLAAVREAYGPGHVDGPWTDEDTAEVSAMHLPGAASPPLTGASAPVRDRAGRSAGHVLCAGPVPWAEDGGGWVLTIGLAARARGRGLGRALLVRALQGTRDAGLPTLGLSVTEGNPAQRLYETTGFAPVQRVLSVRLPGQHGGPATRG